MAVLGLLGLLIAVAALAAGWSISTRFDSDAPLHIHGVRALVLGYGGALLVTQLALEAGLYTRWAALLVAIATLIAAGSATRELGQAMTAGVQWLGDRHPGVRLVAAWTLGLVALGAGRVVEEGVLAWDAISYHLVHAGRWVQQGARGHDPSPDAWSYYEAFATGGDAWWSWFMLGDGSIGALPAGLLLSYVLAGFTLTTAARELGHGADASIAVAILAVSTPAALGRTAAPYVDILLLGLGMGALTLALRSLRRDNALDELVLGAAIAVCIQVKDTALLWLALPLLVLLARRTPWSGLRLFGPLVLLGPAWAHRVIHWGQPLYPIGLPGFGGGNELLAATTSGALFGLQWSAADLIGSVGRMLALPGMVQASSIGFAPVGWLVLGAGFAGWATVVRRMPLETAAAAVCTLPGLYLVLAPASYGVLVKWADSTPRLVLVPWAAILLGLPFVLRRWTVPVVLLAAGAGLLLSTVTNLPVSIASTTAGITAGLVVALVVWSIGRGATGRGLAILAVGCTLGHARTLARPFDPADIAHTSSRSKTSAIPRRALKTAPIWAYLHDRPPAQIALAPVFRPPGHDVFRFLFMGRHSQHTLTHVSPWASGEHIGQCCEQSGAQLDPTAWAERLQDAGIDYLYVERGRAEHGWATARFEAVVSAGDATLFSIPTADSR